MTVSQLAFSKELYIFRKVNITSMTNTICCEYSIKTPDDGLQVCPKHVEFFTKIKLRNSASCWLLLWENEKKCYHIFKIL